jgi:hypothetical protein
MAVVSLILVRVDHRSSLGLRAQRLTPCRCAAVGALELAVCARACPRGPGQLLYLAGSRSPTQPGYDPVDGRAGGWLAIGVEREYRPSARFWFATELRSRNEHQTTRIICVGADQFYELGAAIRPVSGESTVAREALA